jgi:hypothetical protein
MVTLAGNCRRERRGAAAGTRKRSGPIYEMLCRERPSHFSILIPRKRQRARPFWRFANRRCLPTDSRGTGKKCIRKGAERVAERNSHSRTSGAKLERRREVAISDQRERPGESDCSRFYDSRMRRETVSDCCVLMIIRRGEKGTRAGL